MFSHEDCNRIKPLLDAYLDGELNASESQAVDAHISSCDACKRALTEISQVVVSLKRLPPVAPAGRDFADDFERVLAEKTQKQESCKALRPLLDAYHDRELSQIESADVAKHLEGCLNCRGDVGDIGRVAASLRELKPVELPYDFANRFEEVLARRSRVVQFRRPIVWGTIGAVAAAVLALAFHAGPSGGPNLSPNTVASHQLSKPSTLVANNPDQPVAKPPHTAGIDQKKLVQPLANSDKHVRVAVANAVAPAKHPEDKNAAVKQLPLVAQLPPYDAGAVAKHDATVKSQVPDPHKQLAQLPAVAGANSAAPEIAAYDPEHQQTTAEELGISTDEDGLYAIKL